MRYIILMTCFTAFIILGSCEKESAEQSIDMPASIVGNWELRQSSAAMNPEVSVYPPGNGNILKFTNNTYASYINGQPEKSGKYAIINDTTVEENICLVIPPGEFRQRIIYDTNYNNQKKFIQISNNKLVFISGCYAYDAGHSSQYERQPSSSPGK